MKANHLIPALLLAALACAMPAQSLTLSAPNGGESWTLGQNAQIKWTAANVSQKVRLELLRADGGLVGLIATDRDAASGAYAWKIGQSAAGAGAAGQYKVRVVTMDNALQDASDAPFTIAAAPAPPSGLNIGGSGGQTGPPPVTITLLEPSDGRELIIGGNGRIRWLSSGLSGSNQIELWNGASRLGVIAQNQPAFQGDIAWKIGDYAGGTAAAGRGYKVRIVNSGGMEDFSDKAFALAPAITMANQGGGTIQRKQPDFQQQPQFNAQVVPYAVITSFKVNGQDNSGGQPAECRQSQGIPCTVGAFSQTQPVLYRFTLYLDEPKSGMRFNVRQTSWLPQSSYTFTVSLDAIWQAVFRGNPPQTMPFHLRGCVDVEAKNQTQAEPPRSKSIEIKLLL